MVPLQKDRLKTFKAAEAVYGEVCLSSIEILHQCAKAVLHGFFPLLFGDVRHLELFYKMADDVVLMFVGQLRNVQIRHGRIDIRDPRPVEQHVEVEEVSGLRSPISFRRQIYEGFFS